MKASGVAVLALGAALSMGSLARADVPAKAEAEAEQNVFRVEKTEVDLGTIKAGTDAVATFIFHNDGTEPVKIIKAKPS